MGHGNLVLFAFFQIVLILHAMGQNSYEEARPYSYTTAGELNESCRTHKDCRSFAYVCRDNRTCQCDQWYIPDLQRKRCVGAVDQKCLYDEHCIEGAFCMNQSICRCKESTPIPLEYGLVCSGAARSEYSATNNKVQLFIKCIAFINNYVTLKLFL